MNTIIEFDKVSVRDGRLAPVTCVACGCRLEQRGDAWWHFTGVAGRDARGCTVGCTDRPHYQSGAALRAS